MVSHIFNNLLSTLQAFYGNLTQDEIAKELGVTQPTVGNWIRGTVTPNKTSIKKLINLFVRHHAASLLVPIVEFQNIRPVPSGNGWRVTDDTTLEKQLRTQLDGKKGTHYRTHFR